MSGFRSEARVHVRRGFTVVELMIVVVLIGLAASFSAPSVARQIRHARVNQAAPLVATDVEVAFSLAARTRRPVRIAIDSATRELRITDRASGAILRRRPLGTESEWKLDAVASTGLPVNVFPTGVATAPFIIDLTSGGYTKRVSVTRVGLTRSFVP